jgi:hypothetical protein
MYGRPTCPRWCKLPFCALLAYGSFVVSVRVELPGMAVASADRHHQPRAWWHARSARPWLEGMDRGLLGGGCRQSLGCVHPLPPRPPGPVGDACIAASYGGCADANPVVDVGLGVEGGAFHSSYHCWRVAMQMCLGAWMPGRHPEDSSLHGWLSGKRHGVGVAMPFGCLGNEG